MFLGLKSTTSKKRRLTASSEARTGTGARVWIRFGLIWATVVVFAFVGANIFWDRFGSQIVRASRFALTPDSLELGEVPAWIHHDVRPEVLLISFPDGKGNVLDRDVLSRVALAADQHPWIKKVQELRKVYPSKIRAAVVWRQPVAMVRVHEGLLPVDAEGVLLPSRDFTPLEAAQYPRIVGLDSLPAGPAGQTWGDVRVVQAASLAGLLLTDWKKYGFRHIELASDKAAHSAEFEFVIVTQSGSRIVWGHAPSVPVMQEVSPDDKMNRLRAYYKEHGSFDGIDGPQEIDLRPLEGVRVRRLS